MRYPNQRFASASTFLCIFVSANCSYGAIISLPEAGNDFTSATNVDSAFDLAFDGNIFDSTAFAHVTINSRYDALNDIDWYVFEVGSGKKLFLDIDNPSSSFRTTLSLFSSSGLLLAYADSDSSTPPDPGSATDNDAFLGVYTAPSDGMYYVAVSAYSNQPIALTFGQFLYRPDDNGPGMLPRELGGFTTNTSTSLGTGFSGGGAATNGENYTLHISVEGHAVAGVVPEPSSIVSLIGLTGCFALATWVRQRRKRRQFQRSGVGR
jgi:hypothetical protein